MCCFLSNWDHLHPFANLTRRSFRFESNQNPISVAATKFQAPRHCRCWSYNWAAEVEAMGWICRSSWLVGHWVPTQKNSIGKRFTNHSGWFLTQRSVSGQVSQSVQFAQSSVLPSLFGQCFETSTEEHMPWLSHCQWSTKRRRIPYLLRHLTRRPMCSFQVQYDISWGQSRRQCNSEVFQFLVAVLVWAQVIARSCRRIAGFTGYQTPVLFSSPQLSRA